MFYDKTPAKGFSEKTADFNKALREEQSVEIVLWAVFEMTE